MRSERGLSTILHCLQWYKLVLRTYLSTAAVQYVVVRRLQSRPVAWYPECHRGSGRVIGIKNLVLYWSFAHVGAAFRPQNVRLVDRLAAGRATLSIVSTATDKNGDRSQEKHPETVSINARRSTKLANFSWRGLVARENRPIKSLINDMRPILSFATSYDIS